MSISNLTKRNNLKLYCSEIIEKNKIHDEKYEVISIVDSKFGSVGYFVVTPSQPCYITRYNDIASFCGGALIEVTSPGDLLYVDIDIDIPGTYNAIDGLINIGGYTYETTQGPNGLLIRVINHPTLLNRIRLEFSQLKGSANNIAANQYLSGKQYRLEFSFRGKYLTI
jgi:hypothetical protein